MNKQDFDVRCKIDAVNWTGNAFIKHDQVI